MAKTGTGTLTLLGTSTYTGGTTLDGGTLDLAASSAAGASKITFAAGSETLQIENAALSNHTFANTIDSFGRGDVIDLPGLAFAAGATATFNAGTHALTVTSNGVTDTLTLTNPNGTAFKAISDVVSGTEIVMADVLAYEATGLGSHLFGVIDPNTGVFTPRGDMGLTLGGLGSYGGVIYGGEYHGNTLYSVNTSTGALTVVGTGNISYGGFGSTTSGLLLHRLGLRTSIQLIQIQALLPSLGRRG